MSVIGDFRIPAEAFALDHALATVPDMTIEAERNATHSPREVFPFFWATGGDVETFARALAADPSVETASVADEMGDEALYRLKWNEAFLDLIQEMIDHHATVVEATATGDQWHLRLRFADEAMVSSFQSYFRTTGRDFEVISLQHPRRPRGRRFGLTPEQHEALTTAAREGYFSIPRTTSVEAVGDALGISANATSQRIRRGCEKLIRATLLLDPDETG